VKREKWCRSRVCLCDEVAASATFSRDKIAGVTSVLLWQSYVKRKHVKRDILVNFYISLEKPEKYLCNSIRAISTKLNTLTQTVFLNSEVHVVKNFNFKFPRWRTAAVLKVEKLQYLMMKNMSLKSIGRPPSWILKIIFNGWCTCTWKTCTFYIVMPNFVEIDHTVAEMLRFFPKIF